MYVGCHHRWAGWIRICAEYGLAGSMSAKRCSPDNATAEGFFVRLKQEFFHGRDFSGSLWTISSTYWTGAWSGTGTSASNSNTA